jgi:phospholipid-binding lipoprotein MlaA
MKSLTWIIAALALLLSGCTSSEKNSSSRHSTPDSMETAFEFEDEDFDLLEEELDEEAIEIADPLEGVNRVMFSVNDTLYYWIVNPCAKACKRVVPGPARIGIRNFFNNLTTPIRLVNCLLQGKGNAAGKELDRFVINTTFGILGFGDPALDKYGLEPKDEDLGQTLAVYGLGDGVYLVLPLFGPSSARDGVGKVGDLFLNPVFYVEPTNAAIGISAGKNINESSFHIGEYEAFKAAAVDPYIAMREAYIQYRKKKIEE